MSLFLTKVGEVTEFCQKNAGKCFPGWSKEKLFFYVGFHALAGSLLVVRKAGIIQLVAIAFPAQPQDAGRPFNWRLPTPGTALVIFDVIGNRQFAPVLFNEAAQRWPDTQRYFTYRRGKLVELPRSTVKEFCS